MLCCFSSAESKEVTSSKSSSSSPHSLFKKLSLSEVLISSAFSKSFYTSSHRFESIKAFLVKINR